MLGKNLETKSVKQEPKEEPTGTIHDILNDGSNSEELIILYVQHGIALVVVVEKAPQENHCKLKHHKYGQVMHACNWSSFYCTLEIHILQKTEVLAA